MRNEANTKPKRNRLIAGFLAAGVAGTALTAGVVANTHQTFAAPVSVDAPQQSFGFADVVSKVSPAVVSVRVTQTSTPSATMRGFGGRGGGASPFDNLPEDHPLRRFFDVPGQGGGEGGRGLDPRRDRPSIGQGSGFFISEDGYVVTNNHVVDNGEGYTVVMDDGTEYQAELIGTDTRTDLALLKVDADNIKFTYVEFGDDNAVRVGDWVVAVGNPFGLGGSVTAGIISARGRDIGAGPYDDFLQIDAAVNRGNSGGPAFGLDGKVIGVNTAIFSPSGGNVGIAFAIPASVAKQVVQSLREDGSVERGWLGVQIGEVSEDIAEALGLSSAQGAIVTLPNTETPASKAGIETGDVITSVDGQNVESPRELARVIANYNPGASVDITVFRDGSSQDIDVTLGNLSELDEAASIDAPRGDSSPVSPSSLSGYGLTLTPSEDGAGVVVTDVDPDSTAAERGFEAGDTIVAVNGSDVSDQGDVREAIDAASEAGRRAALFQLRNGEGQNRFVALPIEES